VDTGEVTGPSLLSKPTNNIATSLLTNNGELIYCDGEIAVFKTPQGMIKIPFSEILDPFGKPYGKKEKYIKPEEE